MIKRKYENFAYQESLRERFDANAIKRRPYEECYAQIGRKSFFQRLTI
jgi:hypothetical protein